MRSIGVRELRQNASKYLRLVEAGETIEVTDRGRPVAKLTPLEAPKPKTRAEEIIEDLTQRGLLLPAKEPWPPPPPRPPKPGVPLPSEILQEMRDAERF
ncbi:MAG TPA: type II toxin-antitoxin system prevent-host-death family antitoxin [Tepidiformaceae bacterium]|nr:type II toxin-antitoxin system prevent-host-death family antitoxin [Tepidiformaceae bacterium]